MEDRTPAVSIRSKDLDLNAKALDDLLNHIEGDIRTVLDVRYGLGGWAQRVTTRFPRCEIRGYEIDERTFAEAWTNPKVRLSQYPFQGSNLRYDLVLADFNRLTLKRRNELDNLLSLVDSSWLVFTDVSCGKLHLNYSSYGLNRPDLTEYYLQFNVPEYDFVTYSRSHHFASSALFQRKTPGEDRGLKTRGKR